MVNQKPVLQGEALEQVNRPFFHPHSRTEGVFKSVLCPGGGSLPTTNFLVVSDPWNSEVQSLLATEVSCCWLWPEQQEQCGGEPLSCLAWSGSWEQPRGRVLPQVLAG